MFDIRKVGMNIQNLRKANNMTQMELADKLEVSFQAVSNWERGNSMPDIAKLPELSVIFNCTIDTLLGESHDTKLTKALINGLDKQYIIENQVVMKDINKILPIMKPEQAEDTLNKIIEVNDDHINADELKGAAPFLRESFLEKLSDMIMEVNGLNEISSLAPFLSSKALDNLLEKYLSKAAMANECISISEITGLAPFISSESLSKIADLAVEVNGLSEIMGLVPFMDSETLDRLIDKYFTEPAKRNEKVSVSEIIGLAPFLSSETLDKLANLIVDIYDVNEIVGLAPFLSDSTLGELFKKCCDEDKMSKCSGLYPFFPTDVLREIAEKLVRIKGIDAIKEMMPFL